MLIARKEEQKLLKNAFQDNRSHFIAVYGRRRVGKTFLIRETLGHSFTFSHAGLANGSFSQQLMSFYSSLKEYGLTDCVAPINWLEAFDLLKQLIKQSDQNRKVVFIDELSWMDTRRSDLMVAIENFWNGWASARTDIVLIVCASATSWMLNKIVHNKGGLYHRLTDQIALEPFTLHDCEEYLKAKNIPMERYDILELYMILGGVPYYLEHLRKDKSLSQNIDELFFAKHAFLKDEFNYLYASLFRNPEDYIKIVTALGTRKNGMTRTELSKETGIPNTGTFSQKLKELESCGFIRFYKEFGKVNRDTTIQLIDNFTLFYFKFLEKKTTDEYFWTNNLSSPVRAAWSGLAFESVCLQHLPQLLKALGISGVSTDASSWSCKADPDKGINGSQIDLLIERKDRVINLCEMKYSISEFAVTKAYAENLRNKVSDFTLATKTKKSIHLTLVTTYGLKHNSYSGNIQSVVTAEDLFSK